MAAIIPVSTAARMTRNFSAAVPPDISGAAAAPPEYPSPAVKKHSADRLPAN